METGAMHNAQQSWIRGTVKNVVDNKEFGFIKAHGALPPAFINKDVFFRTHLATWNIRTNDLVEFLLKPEPNSRPSAYKMRHIAPDGSVLDSDTSKKRATYVPAKNSAKGNANNFKELHASSSGNSSTELMRCSSESSIINLALSDGEDHAEESSESVSKPVQLRASTKMRFLQVRDKMQFGKIVAIKDAFGFIKRTYEEGQGFQRDIFFSLTSCQSGLFSLVPGDEVSFFVREKRDDKQPYAYNIRLVKGIARSSDVIRKYIELLRESIDTNTSRMVEDLSMALLCTAVWECIGRCMNMGDECISLLVDLLLEFGSVEHLKQNFTSVLETLLSLKLFNPNGGEFVKYVENAATCSSSRMKNVRELISLMMRLVPSRSRQLTSLIAPIVSCDPSSNEKFLYQLLKLVAKNSTDAIESMEWDELPLVPSVDELLSVELESFSSLQRVQIKGPYSSTDAYLDTYFRLLRVDCFSSLTKGVTDLLKGKLDSRDMNVYRGVRLAGVHLSLSGNGMAVGLYINPPFGVNLDHSSNMMFGNLLCISVSGTFRDPIWATVLSRDLLKRHRIIVVELCSESNSMSDSEAALALYFAGLSTVIVESPTYYRAYQPVMKSLQSLSPEDLAFQEELIQCQGSRTPDYIDPESEFDGQIVYPRQNRKLNVLAYTLDNSVLGQTTLDISQESALKECLRNRVAIVQGPPGTGKTFVGVKVVQLIMSLSAQSTKEPILILTYKNHSLDEFLKELVKLFPDGVARVGGRSQEACLKSCSLNELRRQNKMSDSVFKQINAFKQELERLKTSIECDFDFLNSQRYFTVDVLLDHLSNEQLTEFLLNCKWNELRIKPFKLEVDEDNDNEFIEVKKFLSKKDVESILKTCSGRPIREIVAANLGQRNSVGDQLYKLLNRALSSWLPRKEEFQAFETEFSKHEWITSEYQQTPNVQSKTEDDISDERDADELLEERLATAPSKQSDAEEFLKSMSRFQNMHNSKGHLLKVAKELADKLPLGLLLNVHNIWQLNIRDRIQLVQCVLYRKFKEAGDRFEKTFAEYQTVYRSKEELEDQHKATVLQQMKVVGMTVTGANINRGLIGQLKPAVVLVEEAAEVLEPQLVAVLGNWTKHLIMIGDHKQLRPSVENHKLAIEYHLDVSLMERLINNGLSYATLTMQNRMRPEFAELLLDIYPHLQSNLARVERNLPANCLAKSMYFWDHRDQEISGRSFTNPDEAKRAVLLALFLVEQGYSPRQITILSPYLGQVRLIREKVREAERNQKYAEFFTEIAKVRDEESKFSAAAERSIQVCTVDLYQGDENDFVILSLVRSNSRGDIGFVKSLNRRCVAQSRARCGLYFIGNSDSMSRHHYWQKLIDEFRKTGCLGMSISLHCPEHPHLTQISATVADEIPLLKTFCRVPCNAYLPCGKHVCERTCQPKHYHKICRRLVQFLFPLCGHVGTRECYMDESNELCHALIPMIHASCGHRGHRKCHQKESEVSCGENCTKILECSHPCERRCGEMCDPQLCSLCKLIREEEERQRREQEEALREQMRQQALDKIREIQEREPQETLRRIVLSPEGDTAAEYFSVEDRVKRYIQPGHNWLPCITCIEKIVNLKLELEWLNVRSKMFDPTRSELKFHGTNKLAVENIISEGFMLPKSGKQMFGYGLYFASDSSKSAQTIYTKGSNMLLLCDVLLGRSKTVENARPDMTAEKLRRLKYDSLFAKRGTKSTGGVLYDEFVVYDRYQAIPRYVIHYRTENQLAVRSLPVQTADAQASVSQRHLSAEGSADATHGTLYT